MLEGGADVRYVQEQLCHAQLATTQIYTQVGIRTLKAVHTATRPGATLGHKSRNGKMDLPQRAGAVE